MARQRSVCLLHFPPRGLRPSSSIALLSYPCLIDLGRPVLSLAMPPSPDIAVALVTPLMASADPEPHLRTLTRAGQHSAGMQADLYSSQTPAKPTTTWPKLPKTASRTISCCIRSITRAALLRLAIRCWSRQSTCLHRTLSGGIGWYRCMKLRGGLYVFSPLFFHFALESGSLA